MSDFFSSGWAIFIAAITIAGMAFCVFVLVVASRRTVMSAEDNTTGHVWDGNLQELNNPLPRWWMWLFIITIVFSAVYLVLYPGLGVYQGKWGWSQVGQYNAEVEKAKVQLEPLYAQFTSKDAAQLALDSQAMGIGERLFVNNCAQCHGSDARGSKGFPNLTDGDWLYGGEHETIKQTIANGRTGVMPPMAAAVGSAEDVRNLAHYVLSLSGSAHNSIAAQLGKPKFAACAACHGADGKGNQAMGAPNLTDKVWLHGWGEQAIVSVITNGKNNMMPAHAHKLTEPQIHVLAAYVWNLSNTTQTAQAGSSK
ncbi:cytochrome-c oxidase, cbb3-type subunit III [Caldimonas tepidiphila]|uniref:cytochrome-c oxidase, cbb3-type subunit III n=1 Tax=Caldimonas tepidiphila TaxID=2315841 RepID=UPI000E5C5034|nr:cytochrome-c oxidase, cbb3-type subunit III [Caldimonas tepidiphila]